MGLKEVEGDVDEIKLTLHGSDGTGGILGCLKKKISTKMALYIFIVIGIPLFITGIHMWSIQNSFAPIVSATEKRVSNLNDRTIRLEEKYSAIFNILSRLDEKMDRQTIEIKEQIKEIRLRGDSR